MFYRFSKDSTQKILYDKKIKMLKEKDFKLLVNADSIINPPWSDPPHQLNSSYPSPTSQVQGRLTCLQMDPEMNLGSFYKCSYTWNFYGVCMIVSVWLFQILKASKYSLSGSFLVWDSDSLSSWNENGSTLLRDWLRRRPTLNDMVRHHFFHHHTRHTALKTEH